MIKGMSRTEIENIIDEYVLKERDRKILKRRWLDGICYEPLSEEFGLSDRQIKNIVKKHEKILYNFEKMWYDIL